MQLNVPKDVRNYLDDHKEMKKKKEEKGKGKRKDKRKEKKLKKRTCLYLLNVVKFDKSKVQKVHKLHCKVPGSLVCFSC